MELTTDSVYEPGEPPTVKRPAGISGTSVSAFVVDAAIERAEALVAEQMSTTVPADYFDRLRAALDEPDRAPNLAKAARRVERRPRIAAR